MGLGDRKDISLIRLIIISKSEVSIFPIVVIFCRGWMSEVAVPSFAVGLTHVYIPGKLEFASLIPVQSHDARK